MRYIPAEENVPIAIGRLGENISTSVVFDIEADKKEYPNATFALLHRRAKDPAAYPVPSEYITFDEKKMYWLIQSGDLAYRGNGLCEYIVTDGETILKSAYYTTYVDDALDGSGNPPDPWATWVQQVLAAAETVEQAVAHMPTIVNGNWYMWNAETGEYEDSGVLAEGHDGYSPTVTVEVIEGGHRITITDVSGPHTFDVMDGTAEDFIDDTAGDGVTNKTWSANKLAKETTDLSNAIQGKPDIKNDSESNVDLDITDPSGNVIARLFGGDIQTKNFNSAKTPNTSDDSSFADLNVTDEDGNVIVRFGNGGVQTKNFNSADFVGIVGRNKEITDGIYAACRWHQPSASAKQFCILMGTDIHADAVRLGNMVEYLNKIDAIDAGICLGDIAGNTWADDATYYTEQISKTEKPFLTVIGNHDAGAGNTVTTSYTNIADLVAKFITPNIGYADLASGEYQSGKSYYYKDFDSYKIRIIVLNNYEYPSDNDGTNFAYTRGYNCWSQDQIDWFVSVLNSTPSDYGVIIATHFIPTSTSFDKSSIWTSSTMQYSSYSPDTVLASADRNLLADIVNAWINGTTLSKTYSYTVTGGSWSGITVDADFTERGEGEFITWIGGHLHMSVIGSIYSYSDQHVYLVDCSGLNAAMQGDTPRKEGTRSEDAICVLSVDRELKEVKLFRIGAHFTKDAIDRLYGKYSYAE